MGCYHVVEEGLPILQWRLGEQDYRVHAAGERFRVGGTTLSFHPAGHVLGSSQVRIEAHGEVWVASGDYKRDHDPTCAPFEVVPCDVFITECTFGLPIYRWSPASEVAREIVAWREECAANGEAAILYCYALGKAQRDESGEPLKYSLLACDWVPRSERAPTPAELLARHPAPAWSHYQ